MTRMGKMKSLIEKCATGLEGWLCKRLEALSPKARLRVVLAAFTVFATLCLYMTVTAVIGFGKGEKALEIRHIERLDLTRKGSVQEASEQYYKNKMYGKGTEEE